MPIDKIKTVMSHEVVAKSPINEEWKEMPRPAAVMMGRGGQLFNFDAFSRLLRGGGNFELCMTTQDGCFSVSEESAVSASNNSNQSVSDDTSISKA